MARWVAVLAAVWLLVAPVAALGQTAEGEPSLLVLLDASASMAGGRLDTVKQVLGGILDELPPGVPVGLRTFGEEGDVGGSEDACAQTELVVPISPLDPPAAVAAVEGVQPGGSDSVLAALGQLAGDLPSEGVRTVMLLSDGFDDCSPTTGAACEAASSLVAYGIQLRIEAVGIDVDGSAAEDLRCMAEATGGLYRAATGPETLGTAIEAVWNRAFRSFGVLGLSVDGGATPELAPTLDADQYVDRIRPDETLFYRVDLEEGQGLVANAILVGRVEGRDTTATRIALELLAPDGSSADAGEAEGVGETARTVSVERGSVDEEDVGAWYLSLELIDEGGRLASDGYDVELLVDIPGAPVAPAAIPTTAPPGGNGTTPSATTDDGDQVAAGPTEDGGNDLPAAAAFAALASLTAAVIAGLVVHARRTPS